MIRALSPGDWMAFRDIRLEMLANEPEAYAATLSDWQHKPEAMIRDWLANIESFAACQGPRLMSCAALSRGRQPGTRHRAEVLAVYTRPGQRRQGLMRSVLGLMADRARESGVLQLELQVNAGNTVAIAAYERLGFTRFGLLPRAILGPEGFIDDVLMVRALDTPA